MNKIKKGIKKKIKGKKGKHDEDDLFSPEQLAKFKAELEAKKAQEAAGQGDHHENESEEEEEGAHPAPGPTTSASANKAGEDEEWQKFKALTSGVDSILKKTTGDLDRIKKESFFQRNPPNSAFVIPTHGVRPNATTIAKITAADLAKSAEEQKEETEDAVDAPKAAGWVDLETESKESAFEAEPEVEAEDAEAPEPKLPESPDFEPVEVEDDLFDTSFLNAIEEGNIKLAYIPDSPVEEETGDDPFDTSVADHVVKAIEEEEKKKKRQVNLGLATAVLTGKPAEKLASEGTPGVGQKSLASAGSIKGTRRPRPHRVNLLALDGETPPEVPPDIVVEEKSNPVLDQLLGSPVEAVDPPLTELLAASGQSVSPIPVVVPTPVPEADPLKELLDEFDVIDKTPIPNVNLVAALEEDDLEDEFAALAAESVHKDHNRSATASPAPGRPPPPGVKVVASPEEPDPFDTTYAEAVVGEKVEKAEDVLGDYDDFDFDPRAGEEPSGKSNLSLQQDLLGGSATDLNVDIGADPLQPVSNVAEAVKSEVIEEDFEDPFDTTVYHKLLPGKAELKLLEEEFLSEEEKARISAAAAAVTAKAAIPDDEFDPRKDEIVKAKPPPRPAPPVKAPEVHPLDVEEPVVSADTVGLKALTPQTELDISVEDIDPFDTSIVNEIILPGKQELKLLESELVSPGGAHQVLPFPPVIPPAEPVSVTQNFDPLTNSSAVGEDEFDFDPRAGEPVREFIAPAVTAPPRDIFDTTPSELPTNSPLLPVSEPKAVEYADPFDTSSLEIDNLLPGKAELKFLEKELLESTEDFKPPQLPQIPVPEPPPVKEPEPEPEPELHPLELHDNFHTDFADEPLKPVAAAEDGLNFDDPFDTSIATTIVPGKAELKILEEELFSAPSGIPNQVPKIPAAATLTSQPLIPQQVQPLAPAPATAPADDFDPFDTTSADAILPGKAELKILEAELL